MSTNTDRYLCYYISIFIEMNFFFFFLRINEMNLKDLYTHDFDMLIIMGCPGLEPGTSRME